VPTVAVQTTPKVRKPHIQVLADDELATLFQYIKERPLYMPVLLAASTGMRRGEILGLRRLRLRSIDLADSSDSGGSEEERFDQGAEDGAEPKDDRPARDHRAGAKGSSQSASRTFASNSGAVGSSWCSRLGMGN